MPANPLEDDEMREQRIRERAYHLWQLDGQPNGADLEYWERARTLVALEDSTGAGQLSLQEAHHLADRGLVEEAAIQENLGEFPDSLSDQGDRAQTPHASLRH